MQTGFPAATVVAALAMLCACRGEAAMNDAAPAAAAPLAQPTASGTSLPLIWQGARRLNIVCVVTGSGDTQALGRDICARVRAAAAQGAPLPIETIAPGDPAVLDARDVSLLVQASLEADGAERLLAFSIRPYRAAGVETDMLFGAPPRAVRLPSSGEAAAALDAALAASLAETLPWLAGPRSVQPIS